MAEQLPGGVYFEGVGPSWQNVEQFLPSTDAMDSSEISGQVFLVSIFVTSFMCSSVNAVHVYSFPIVFCPGYVRSVNHSGGV